jgi:hypothetical protein
MDFFKDKYSCFCTNSTRIYVNYIVFSVLTSFIIQKADAQIPLETGDFKTIASGDFENASVWEVWDGLNWVSAAFGVKPNRNNNIFLDQGHEIRLNGIEEAKNVYLFSAATPGRLLNLQSFELHIYGALRAMREVSGEFELNNVTNATIDWIYPESGKIVFKGTSRMVVDRPSWSANTTNSKFTVVFDPNPGETLIVNSAFKANAFIIQTGTVIQTVNSMGVPACSTFSFNIQAMFNGTGPYGDLIIEPGATLISECFFPLAQIIRRSETIPANLFHLKPGANFVLLGNDPVMDAANFLFEGNVYYRSNTGNQRLVRSSMAASENPKTYHNILFENAANKLLPDSVFLRGDFVRLTGGNILEAPTYLRFEGAGIQQVVNWPMDLQQIAVDKPSGKVVLSSDLRAKSNFFMKQGQLDFNGFDLYVNTSGGGSLNFSGGNWLNLHQLHYNQIPTTLNTGNATFPFEDAYNGGIRKIRLLGNSPGGNLSVRFMEIPEANWDPMFNDSDGTPILYQLNSYFEFSGLLPSTDDIELRISAENLIVDNVDDIRIVSNGLAAPGIHLPGSDPDTLWARRDLQFWQLDGVTLTIGSYRELSILPVTWLESHAQWKEGEIHISWATAKESDNLKFLIYRSLDGLENFHLVGEVSSYGNSETTQHYHYTYKEKLISANVFYRIQQKDQNGQSSYSKVFRLEGIKNEDLETKFRLWPNPYTSGPVQISRPQDLDKGPIRMMIFDIMGHVHYSGNFEGDQLEQILKRLNPGLYLLEVSDNRKRHLLRFFKK